MKRIISLMLAVLLIAGTVCVAASAEEAEVKTYKYVALGDSIASGYGLEGKGELGYDRALILNQALIDNPIQDAYANVFGKTLAEIGAENGYTTSATNLAATAYRAEDIAKVITTPEFKGDIATYILETFLGEGSSQALVPYHEYYETYVNDADLVSIQLGANDIIMAVVYPMINSDNVVLKSMGLSVALLLFGTEPTLAVGAGVQNIMKHKDEITAKDIAEAAKYLADVTKNADANVQNSADNVKNVVETVKSVNPDADIALIGMFNPYGNSLELDGQVRDIGYVMKSIFVQAVDEAIDVEINVGDIEVVPADPEQIEEKTNDLKSVSIEITDIVVDDEYFKELRKERLKALLTIAANEIAYPVQYMTAGKMSDYQLRLLNEKLKGVAAETGAVFVDVYNISNECNTDPHPLASGHAEIAAIMAEKLRNTVLRGMGVEVEDEDVIGDADGDGQITIIDVSYLQEINIHKIHISFSIKKLDVNGDGEVDVVDETWIQRMLSGMELPEWISIRFA